MVRGIGPLRGSVTFALCSLTWGARRGARLLEGETFLLKTLFAKLTGRALALGLGFLLSCPLFHAALVPTYFMDCVVALGRKVVVNPVTHQQQWTPEASGFLYGEFVSKADEKNNNYQVFLVTNRHVIEEHASTTTDPLSVRFNLSLPGSAREYDVPLRDERGRPTWHFHPNPEIDIAVIPINGPFLKAEGARHFSGLTQHHLKFSPIIQKTFPRSMCTLPSRHVRSRGNLDSRSLTL